ncbi:MAG TPA: CBS domain-containing protein [Gemmatimonadales bacterium]|jgi:CBS domain-containing protein|nr:CBS domain-containing protein [Gemmatimonadales bacterium]
MTLVRDIMSTQLVVVSPQLSLRDLVELLANEHLGGAPVVAEDKVVGVVTLDDIMSFQASLPAVPRDEPGERDLGEETEPRPEIEQGDEADAAFFVDLWPDAGAELPERADSLRGPEWDLLSEHTVEEVMSRKLQTIGSDQPVEAAAQRMQEADIHRLLVVDHGRLSGIVTTSDVSRAVAEGRA